jgi:poly(glycerol-phosphate) alpha-glucosyltransferase
MHPGVVARKAAAAAGAPLVVSAHGMLDTWALRNSALKKRVAGWLFENRNLRQAACLHALCGAEAKSYRDHGLRNPICIIPNGVDMPETGKPLAAADTMAEKYPGMKGRRRILFLSRLHPKKGLSNLLQAWSKIQKAESRKQKAEEWVLAIAGAGQPAYERELRTLVKDYALEKSVVFLGPVYGEDKRQVLAAADAFVLPSFSEGFSVAILEAAAAGLPVLLTRECNFPELVKSGAAIEIAPQPSAIEAGLRQIMELSEGRRKDMGRRGLELVKQSYTWPTIAGQMTEVYRWLLGGGAKPECIQTKS